ncbi:MAG: DUF2065 family protein [Betaproteobacteria bacterium]|nr:DUF2065 family protein [Betaproteobacteria bacterium]
MAESLLTALGLVLIIEGLLPFAAPTLWRQTLARLAQAPDAQVRLVALGALIAGMALLLL